MQREEFREFIRRRFGWPLINVELHDDHINDNIFLAMQKYTRFAIANASQEHFMTLMLSGGQRYYNLPEGVVEVVSVEDQGKDGGINTLFTIDNYLYQQGAFNFLNMNSGFSLVSYHIAMGFIETIKRYTPSRYTFKYHKESNLLEVNPTPLKDKTLMISQLTSAGTYEDVVVVSPGFVLLKTYMLEGSTEPGFTIETFYERMFERDWIIDYVTALCKITLGMIRNKMTNAANTVGNIGLSMDGAELLQQGNTEKETLERQLQETEAYEGLGIFIG
jgi:hypothetical protein